jgi:hypothetical protein
MVAPGLEVIADEYGIKAEPFGQDGIPEELVGPELLRRCLVSQS